MDNTDNVMYNSSSMSECNFISSLPILIDVSNFESEKENNNFLRGSNGLENDLIPSNTITNYIENQFGYCNDFYVNYLQLLEQRDLINFNKWSPFTVFSSQINEEVSDTTSSNCIFSDIDETDKILENTSTQNEKCTEIYNSKQDLENNYNRTQLESDVSNDKNVIIDEDDQLLDLKVIRLIKKKLQQTVLCEKCYRKVYQEETLQYNKETMCFECIIKIPTNQWRLVRDREWKTTELTKTRICKHCKAPRSFYRFYLNVSTMSFQYCYHCKIKKAWRHGAKRPKYKRRSYLSFLFGDLEQPKDIDSVDYNKKNTLSTMPTENCC